MISGSLVSGVLPNVNVAPWSCIMLIRFIAPSCRRIYFNMNVFVWANLIIEPKEFNAVILQMNFKSLSNGKDSLKAKYMVVEFELILNLPDCLH